MKILIAGSTGLVGAELVPCLRDRGHEVFRLVRHENQLAEDALLWDPQHREIHPEEFEGFDTVINLAGENIANGRWTPEKKRKIYDSRVIGTHMLAELLARLKNPPQLLINASAIGYYGNRGDEILDESSSSGEGFLAEVCRKWEEAADSAKNAGIRVVKLRLGIVLSPEGGVLSKMLLPFKLCVGGVIGSGTQYMSWISIDDLMGVFLHVLSHPSLEGSLNTCSPSPVTNREFTKTLGRILKRPTLFPLPAAVAHYLLGEMADELLLSSTRALPTALEKSGYCFLYPHLKECFKHLLGRS